MSRFLPRRPSEEHLRKEARRLQRACRSGQISAIRLMRAHLPRLAGRPRDGKGWHTGITLQETQFTLARDYGFESWPRMMAFVDEKAEELRFGDSIKRILEVACTEAARRGDRQVGSAHLLLAMAGEEMRLIVGPLLEQLGVTPEEVRRAAESSVSSGSCGSADKRVLEYAADEARGSGHRDVQCEHLLLGVLKDRDAMAAQLLSKGLRYEAAKKRFTSRSSGRVSPQ